MAELPETKTESQGKPPSRLKKFVKGLFIGLLLFILLVVGAGVFIAAKYQEEAKSYVISKLNERLNSEVIVLPQDIEFSVLSNFPNASVDFKHVAMLDAVSGDVKKDTLFRAGAISLQFNIRDLFNKHYVIKRIDIRDVQLKLWVDKKGNDNFHFLKPSTDTSTVKDTSAFALDKIVFKNIAVQYRNSKTRDDYNFTLKTADLKGQFSSTSYTLKTELNLFVDHIKDDKTAYIQHRNISLHTELEVDGPHYVIKKGELSLEKLALNLSGTIDHQDSSNVFHLRIGGKNMDIQSACSWMPGKFKKDIEEFESKGNFYFQAAINGSLSKKHVPEITASFGVDKGSIRQTKEDLTMHDVQLQGEYSNAGKGKLYINSFSGVLPEGSIKGNFNLENFSDPLLQAKAEGNVNLTELQKFLRIDTIESLSGKMKINATFSGKIRKTAGDYVSEDKTSGELTLSDVNMRLRKNNLHFDGFSGTLSLANNDVEVRSFKGRVSNSDFSLDGTFKNLLAWMLIKDEPLTVNVNLNAKKIDLNDLLNDKTAPASKAAPTYKLNLSKYLDLTLHSEIENLVFRKFEATAIHGVLRMKDKRVLADPLSFHTMDGTISITGALDGSRADSVRISCDADIQKVNITRMFTQLENFGQQTLVDKNVKGVVTAKAQMTVPCGLDLTPNTARLLVKCDVSVVNGELIKLASLKSLSKFISLKELEDIRFSKLATIIDIRNRVINIPETQVNSNALDIEVSGKQDFDGNVDYLFGLYLSELLAKKAKANRPENGDNGEEDSEDKHRFRLFISMKGPIDNPVISYDHKAAKAERKEQRKAEKEKLKGLLNEEFGWFKKDSLAVKRNKDKKKNAGDDKFKIKFEEDDKKKKETPPDESDF